MQRKKENYPSWYLLYTNPRAEKKVGLELQKRGFEIFLPLQKTQKQWSDRKKWIEEPLFKSYIFIFTELERSYFEILNIHGVVKFINFEKSPVIVDPREIELVKLLLGNIENIEVITKDLLVSLNPGDEMEVVAGPLKGNSGKLVNRKGNGVLLIELSSIQQNLLVSIPKEYLKISKMANLVSN